MAMPRLLLVFACFISVLSHAAPPHRFSAGDPALASEVNENFTYLDDRMTEIASDQVKSNKGQLDTTIDCGADQEALAEAIDRGFQYITVTGGTCRGNLDLRNQNITLAGSGDAALATTGFAGGDVLTVAAGAKLTLSDMAIEGFLRTKQHAVLSVTNSEWSCTGSTVALDARSSSIELNNVSLSGCPSIHAAHNSTVWMRNGISVEGHGTKPAIAIGRSSDLEVDGLTVTMTLEPGQDTRAIIISGQSFATIRNGTIEGSVALTSSSATVSHIEFSSPIANYPMKLDAIDNGSLAVHDVDLSGMTVGLFRSSMASVGGMGSYNFSEAMIDANGSFLSTYGNMLGDITIRGVNSSHIQLWHSDDQPTNEAVLDIEGFSTANVASEVTAPNVDASNCGSASRIMVQGVNICP